MLSLSAWLRAADAQVVVVQRRIEDQEKLALCLVSPHRIRRKHHHVTTTDRNVDNRGPTCKLVTTSEHAADQEVLLILHESQHDTRSQLRRHEERTLPRIRVRI